MKSLHSHDQRIAIAHPRMARGGAESRVVWGIQALKDDYAVTLLTTGNVGCQELEELNRFYGTSLQWGDFDVLKAPAAPQVKIRKLASWLRKVWFRRFCRKMADQFDVLVSASNLCNFGKPGIQFIVDIGWDSELRSRFKRMPAEAQRSLCRGDCLRRIGQFCAQAMKKLLGQQNLFSGEDLLVANSQWTKRVMEERFGVKNLPIVFPPVVARFPQAPWQTKELGFICMGRNSREKRIETIIEILRQVREKGHDIHLHVIGPMSDHSSYGQMIRHLCEMNSSWVMIEGSQSGAAKAELLAKHRFGIHACSRETFGIAVAEMVAAGCITFVPNSGGPVEIVNDNSLCYQDVDDAVAKIDAVLRNTQKQSEIAASFADRTDQFSTARFMREFRGIVEDFAERS